MLVTVSHLGVIRSGLARARFDYYCEEALKPLGHKPACHHRLMMEQLARVANGKRRRLMLFLPPGAAKSVYASQLFPAWYMGVKRRNVIGVSYGANLAKQFSGKAQGFLRDMSPAMGVGLASESVERWKASNGSEYLSAGAGGAITGFRADCIIIDDPHKNREEADSLLLRDKIWNGYWSDVDTRLKPDGSIIIIQTRWHEDDLSGRLLSVEAQDWDVLSMPALATKANDPLGRQIGEPLWSDDAYGYGAGLLKKRESLERAGAIREWEALYQQEPKPREGSLFKVGKIKELEAAPVGGQVVRAWDLAATSQSGSRDPDYTVGVKLLRTPDGAYVVLDVKRFRGGPEEVEAEIVATARLDGRSVKISLPQDPGAAGKSLVFYLTRALAGYRVESSPETGDKETRAAPVASQVNVGNFSMVRPSNPRDDWTRPFIAELGGFPSATKDDQVDALSRAFSMVGLARPPMRIDPAELARI